MPRSSGPGDGLSRKVDSLEAVLFDLDGTLIDTIDLIRTSMRHATFAVLGRVIPDEELMHNVGVPLIVQMREFDPDRAEELLRAYREHNAVVHDELVRAYDGVEEVLAELQARGARLGIVTSKSRPVAMRGIELFGLGRYFDIVVTADDVVMHKPDPYPLLEAAGSLGAAPERCAYVGDSPHDMTAAVAAGCVAIGATWGVADRARLLVPGPTHLIDSIAELIDLLDGGEQHFRV